MMRSVTIQVSFTVEADIPDDVEPSSLLIDLDVNNIYLEYMTPDGQVRIETDPESHAYTSGDVEID